MELSVALCGDIMFGAEVGDHIGSATVADWLDGVASAWRNSELVIGNLECPCVSAARPDGRLPKELVFHAPVKRLTELAAAGFSAVTMANNHVLNCGVSGLRETLQGLRNAGLHYAGAGMNLEEALAPAFIPVGGGTVALVAFCYGPAASRTSAGVAPHDFTSMRKAMKRARAQADLVIAALHDGIEYSDVPPSATRARFRFLAENGADIVFGHHPHVLQGLEWVGNVPVAYSLGDLLFHNSLPHVAQRNFARMAMARYAPDAIRRDPDKFKRGAVLTVKVDGQKKTVAWHPFRQSSDLRPQLCVGDDEFQAVQELRELSVALLEPADGRHALVDSVLKAVELENTKLIGVRDVLKLARRPKWRYLPRGFKWLSQRLRSE
jgi:hypothetical protein